MLGKSDPSVIKIRELEGKQTLLTKKVNLLQEEIRRLRDEITLTEGSKKQTADTRSEIESTIREIEKLQNDIRGEVGKLSSKANEIRGTIPQTATQSVSDDIPMAPPPPPPPPDAPPPPPPSMLTTKVKPAVVRTKAPDKVVEPTKFTPSDITEAKLKSSKTPVVEKTAEDLQREQVEKIQRYESSIKRKEDEIDLLIAKVSEFSTKLETAKESQGQYEAALGAQKELLAGLKGKKTTVEDKLKTVKEKVGTKLHEIEVAEEQRKLAEEALKLKAEQETTASLLEVPDAPMAPPLAPSMDFPPSPPPPPPMGNPFSGISLKKATKPEVVVQEVPKPSSKPGEIDTNALTGTIGDSQKRRALEEAPKLLAKQLIALALEIGNKDLDDVDLDENQQQLFDSLDKEGWEELKGALNEGVKKLPNSKSAQQLLVESTMKARRGAIAEGNSADDRMDVSKVAANREKFEITEAVSNFIKNNPNKDLLLRVSQDIKVREEKAADARREADEVMRVEAQAQQAAQEKIAKEKQAAENQVQLKEMGVKAGVVSISGVHEAELDKVKVIADVSDKQANIRQTDVFISGLDKELEDQIALLQEAQKSYLESLEASSKVVLVTEPIIEPSKEVDSEVVAHVDTSDVVIEAQQDEVDAHIDASLTAVVIKAQLDEVDPEVSLANGVGDEVRVVQAQSIQEVIINEPIKIHTPQKIKDTPTFDQEVADTRKAVLQKAHFDQRLLSLAQKANSLESNGFTAAAKEARGICTKLINAREDYVSQKINSAEFAVRGEESIKPANTKALSESRGFLGAICRVVNAIVSMVKGTSSFTEANKTSQEKISNIKESLQQVKEQDSAKDLTEEVREDSRLQM